jgi:type I restriction enzyme S subunit
MPAKPPTKKQRNTGKQAKAIATEFITKPAITPPALNNEGLPDGWRWVKLSEVCDKISLNNIKIKQKDYLLEGKFPVVDQGQDLIGGYYNDEELVVPSEPPFIIFGDHTKIKKYIPFKFIAGADGVKVLKAKEEIDPKFLFYSLFTIKIEDKGYARHFQLLEKELFRLPPISDQHAIVSKIEELLSELDKGKQQLETAKQQLKIYRRAVLKWAFEGKLSELGRVGLKDDRIMDEAVKGEILQSANPKNPNSDNELPEGWKWVKIEDIATVGTGATPLKNNKSFYENGNIAWVTSGALNDEYVREANDYVTEKALKETNLSLYPKGTLLLAMYGEGKTRGKCSELLIEATTNQAIAAIHFKRHDEKVRPYLKYFLLKNYNDIRRLSSGGVQPNLNLGIVKRTQIPFPPIEEQCLIVQEIESRLSVCDKVEETITTSLAQVETLRQSILKKAFEGKLV